MVVTSPPSASPDALLAAGGVVEELRQVAAAVAHAREAAHVVVGRDRLGAVDVAGPGGPAVAVVEELGPATEGVVAFDELVFGVVDHLLRRAVRRDRLGHAAEIVVDLLGAATEGVDLGRHPTGGVVLDVAGPAERVRRAGQPVGGVVEEVRRQRLGGGIRKRPRLGARRRVAVRVVAEAGHVPERVGRLHQIAVHVVGRLHQVPEIVRDRAQVALDVVGERGRRAVRIRAGEQVPVRVVGVRGRPAVEVRFAEEVALGVVDPGAHVAERIRLAGAPLVGVVGPGRGLAGVVRLGQLVVFGVVGPEAGVPLLVLVADDVAPVVVLELLGEAQPVFAPIDPGDEVVHQADAVPVRVDDGHQPPGTVVLLLGGAHAQRVDHLFEEMARRVQEVRAVAGRVGEAHEVAGGVVAVVLGVPERVRDRRDPARGISPEADALARLVLDAGGRDEELVAVAILQSPDTGVLVDVEDPAIRRAELEVLRLVGGAARTARWR